MCLNPHAQSSLTSGYADQLDFNQTYAMLMQMIFFNLV